MKKKTTVFGLSTQKISYLLKICADSSLEVDMETQQKMIELLQDRLSETLLKGSLKGSPLSEELTYLCHISGIAAGDSIRTLLANPETDTKLIDKIKEHGKTLSQNAQNTIDHDTANAIYYAAIAHALIYHHSKITKFTFEELEQSMTVFIGKEWVSKDLVKLFEKAVKYCQEQLNNNKGN